MKNRYSVLPILLLLAVAWAGCSRNDDQTRYISKNAIGVISLNTERLAKKIVLSSLSGSSLMQQISKYLGSDSTNLDLEKTGIDPLSTFYAYAVADQRFSGGSRFVIILPLKKADNFNAFLKSKFPSLQATKNGAWVVAAISENAAIGWDEHTAIVVSAGGDYYDNTSNGQSLAAAVAETFNLKKEESLASAENFKEMAENNHDIGYWVNYEVMAATLPQDQMGSPGAILATQKKLVKDAYVIGGVDFEKGKVMGTANYHYNPTMGAILAAFESNNDNDDLLHHIPGRQMNLMLDTHFDPKGVKVLIDSLGQYPLVESALKEYGLSTDKVLAAFTGDFLVSVADFTIKTESRSYAMGDENYSYTSPTPHFKANMVFKIGDHAAFDQLMQVALQNEILTQAGAGIYKLGEFATLVVKGNYAAVSNDAAVAAAATQNAAVPANIPSELKEKPTAFYADIKNSIRPLPLDLLYGKEDTAVFADGKKLIESITGYSKKPSKKSTEIYFEVKFQNKDENSLMQIINFAQKVADAESRNGNEQEETYPADSTDI
ncbi:MAG: DUF4836 family protein [Edaphocola sp.]